MELPRVNMKPFRQVDMVGDAETMIIRTEPLDAKTVPSIRAKARVMEVRDPTMTLAELVQVTEPSDKKTPLTVVTTPAAGTTTMTTDNTPMEGTNRRVSMVVNRVSMANTRLRASRPMVLEGTPPPMDNRRPQHTEGLVMVPDEMTTMVVRNILDLRDLEGTINTASRLMAMSPTEALAMILTIMSGSHTTASPSVNEMTIPTAVPVGLGMETLVALSMVKALHMGLRLGTLLATVAEGTRRLVPSALTSTMTMTMTTVMGGRSIMTGDTDTMVMVVEDFRTKRYLECKCIYKLLKCTTNRLNPINSQTNMQTPCKQRSRS